ncbi:MAG: OmpA family protein [Candidatus Cryptobacteroides sp.]
MKRILINASAFVLALTCAFSTGAYAQENNNRDDNGKIVRGPYETNKAGDNWFVGAGAGINSWWGSGAKGKVGVAVDVNAGKWFTPTLGARIGWRGVNDKVSARDGFVIDGESFNLTNVHADLLWNVSNSFGGYKETRTWNVILYPTFSYLHSSEGGRNEFGAGAGLINYFRLSNRVGLSLDLSALATKTSFVPALPTPKNYVSILPTATFGVVVNLGKTNFKRHSSVVPAVVPVSFTEDQYRSLCNRVDELEKENSDLRDELADAERRCPETVTVTKAPELVSPATVYFEIGSAELSEKELARLDFYVRNILEMNPDKTFTLTGSADKGTGSASRNQYLSEKRVNNVKEILVGKYGIAEDRLVVKADGDTNNRFGSAALNRVVTIE